MLFGDGTRLILVETVIVCNVYFQDQGTWRDAEEKEVDVFGTVEIVAEKKQGLIRIIYMPKKLWAKCLVYLLP